MFSASCASMPSSGFRIETSGHAVGVAGIGRRTNHRAAQAAATAHRQPRTSRADANHGQPRRERANLILTPYSHSRPRSKGSGIDDVSPFAARGLERNAELKDRPSLEARGGLTHRTEEGVCGRAGCPPTVYADRRHFTTARDTSESLFANPRREAHGGCCWRSIDNATNVSGGSRFRALSAR